MPSMHKLSNYATTVSRGADGVTRVTYHNTVIVAFGDTHVILDTGGFDTVTTRRKMQQAAHQFSLPYRVFRKAGETMVQWTGAEPVPLTYRACFMWGKGA